MRNLSIPILIIALMLGNFEPALLCLHADGQAHVFTSEQQAEHHASNDVNIQEHAGFQAKDAYQQNPCVDVWLGGLDLMLGQQTVTTVKVPDWLFNRLESTPFTSELINSEYDAHRKKVSSIWLPATSTHEVDLILPTTVLRI